MSLLVLAMGLAWTMGILFFSLSMNVGQHRQTVEVPPPHFQNLWPDDASSAKDLVPGLLQECLPPACVPTRSVKKYEKVLLVRPPGPLGDILVAFCVKYLADRDPDMQLTSTTAPLSAPFPDTTNYDALIHLVTLPLLLEALDMLLLAATPTQALLTPDDVVAVVQHLVTWHCRVAAHAHELATVVLTLDPTLSFPLRSEGHLRFLVDEGDVDETNPREVPVPRQDLAEQTLAQLDRGTAFWQGLLATPQLSSLRSKAASPNLLQRVDALLRRLLPDGQCPAVTTAAAPRGWFAAASPVESLLESLWVDPLLTEERSDEN
jgi:hypothetical protein